MVADILVVGAGINGAAVAREATLDGLAVTVVDAGDLAAGTSSASSRMIHGGIRYLENGEVRLVRQSLAERERLLRTAPHLVHPYGLLIPVYRGNGRAWRTLRAGMVAYDLLSLDKTTPWHRGLSVAETLRRYPGLERTGLQGALLYHDAAAPACERLVVEQLLDAAALGASVRTHHRVVGTDRGRDGVFVVDLVGAHTGSTSTVRARTVVNCAGPAVDAVLRTAEPAGRRRLIGGTKGSHLVLPAFPGAPPTGVHYEADDGRAVLVLPQPDGTYLVGSTDLFVADDDAEQRCTGDERDYLLAQVNRLIPGAGLGPDDVLSSYSGVRPLPASDAATSAEVSRDHHVVADPAMPGLFSVVGGKLTTHRALGEKVLDTVRPCLGRRGRARHPSRTLPLPGARCADRAAFRAELLGRTDHPAEVLTRLVDLYGVRAARVLALADDDASLAGRIPGTDTLAAEVALALREEFAVTLTDVLVRRLMLGRRRDLGVGCAADVAAVCARVAGWDDARTRRETDDHRAWARAQHPITTEESPCPWSP